MDLAAVIGHISMFLQSDKVFLQLTLVCKQWKQALNTPKFAQFWVKNRLNTSKNIPYTQIIKNYNKLNKREILRFQPLKSDGGIGQIEHNNRFTNMWEYSGAVYSTYYIDNQMLPLQKPVNCIGYFDGTFDTQNFVSRFHHDAYQIILRPNSIPPQYRNYSNATKALTLDPIRGQYHNLYDYNTGILLEVDQFIGDKEGLIQYQPVIKKERVAFINKIGIARPYAYTGAVETLMVCVQKQWQDFIDLQQFEYLNQVSDLRSALELAPVQAVAQTDSFFLVEYKQAQDFYPLLWVKFRSWEVNNLVYQMKQIVEIKQTAVKLISINDTREDFDLLEMQPNYDITYCVFMGTAFKYN